MGTKLSLSVLIVGVFGRGSLTDTSADAFTTERHSAGIELIILMRKNLCSGFKRWVDTIQEGMVFRDQISYLYKA